MSRPDLNCADRITEAINLILLIQLGAASIQSDDGSAIAQGCASALEKLGAAEALLAQIRAPLQPDRALFWITGLMTAQPRGAGLAAGLCRDLRHS